MAQKKDTKKVRDLAPKKDAKGGRASASAMGGAAAFGGSSANRGGASADRGGASANRGGASAAGFSSGN